MFFWHVIQVFVYSWKTCWILRSCNESTILVWYMTVYPIKYVTIYYIIPVIYKHWWFYPSLCWVTVKSRININIFTYNIVVGFKFKHSKFLILFYICRYNLDFNINCFVISMLINSLEICLLTWYLQIILYV
jgi:hypothetical protein